MPQGHALYFISRQIEPSHTLRFHAPDSPLSGHDTPVFIQYLYLQFIRSHLVRQVAHVGLYTDGGRTSLMRSQGRRGHKRAIPIDVHGVLLHQTHVTVDTSTKHMFTSTRSHVAPPRVVHPYGDLVLSLSHVWRETDVETGVAPFMRRGQTAIHIYFCHLEHSVELQKDFPLQVSLVQPYCLAIPTVTGIKVLPHEIGNAERMGQADVLPS